MTETLENREGRREALKDIIMELHRGKSPEEMKARFGQLLSTAGATEIGQLESELIASGLPETEVRRLCDVHVAVFQDALETQESTQTPPGHPLHTFQEENRATERVVTGTREALTRLLAARDDEDKAAQALTEVRFGLHQLGELEKHYSRKENLLFPYLEKHGLKGPPAVMWALHDDIRASLKRSIRLLDGTTDRNIRRNTEEIEDLIGSLLETISGLVYKEDNILLPMALQTLTKEEWAAIEAQSPGIGYAFIEPPSRKPADPRRTSTGEGDARPQPPAAPASEATASPAGVRPASIDLSDARLHLNIGELTIKELDLLLNHLPIDITFVDRDDRVRYFSAGGERIFVRTEAVIGREVQNCHPPASVHIVNQILDDFKSGRRDSAEFWLNYQGAFVHIRYFAVRDDQGRYVGTLEVTQDITAIRQLSGERRLLGDD